jgi:hypothetical protein
MSQSGLTLPTKTEAEARTERLAKLLEAKNEAKALYSAAYERCEREKDFGNGGTFSLMRPIQLDIAKRKALADFVKAEDAYHAALDEFIKSGAEIIEFPGLEAAGAGGIK